MTAPAAPLTTRQAKHLRALAHHLDPLVLVGKEGGSPAITQAITDALAQHELLKVRLPQVEKAERRELARALEVSCECHLVGEIGRVAIFYKRHPEKPRITLPG